MKRASWPAQAEYPGDFSLTVDAQLSTIVPNGGLCVGARLSCQAHKHLIISHVYDVLMHPQVLYHTRKSPITRSCDNKHC